VERSESIAELAKSLVKFHAKYIFIPKDKVNPFFGSKYADLSSINEAVNSELSSAGLAITQTIEIDGVGAPCLLTVLIHESGEYISSQYAIKPEKDTPQGIGSAITYARRYAKCAILDIAADEDDDGNAASEVKSKRERAPRKRAKAEPPKKDKYLEMIESSTTLAATAEAFKLSMAHAKSLDDGPLQCVYAAAKDKKKEELELKRDLARDAFTEVIEENKSGENDIVNEFFEEDGQ